MTSADFDVLTLALAEFSLTMRGVAICHFDRSPLLDRRRSLQPDPSSAGRKRSQLTSHRNISCAVIWKYRRRS